MNPLLESLARRGVDCTKGMKMEAPPLPGARMHLTHDGEFYSLRPTVPTDEPIYTADDHADNEGE